MSSLPQVSGGGGGGTGAGGQAPSPSSLLETLRKRQKQRAAGETQTVTQVLEGLEQVVITQSELLERQEQQLQRQEEDSKARISAIQRKANADRDDLIDKIKEFTSAMDLQLQNLGRKLSASRGDNKVLDERQRNLIGNIDLMKEQLDLLTQEVIGE